MNTSEDCSNNIPNIGTTGCNRFHLDDLRYQAYSSIIHGAKGVWFWSYGQTFEPCEARDGCQRYREGPTPYFVDNLVPLSVELDSLSHFFTGQATVIGRRRWPDSTTGVGTLPSMSGATDSIHCALFARGKDVLFVAANIGSTSSGPIGFDFKALAASQERTLITDARAAEVLFEATRSRTTVSDGVISDEFPPFGVRIFRFKRKEVPG